MFGQRVREIRKKKGLEQQFVNAAMKKHKTWLTEIENGKRKRIQPEDIVKLAEILEVSVEKFFEPDVCESQNNSVDFPA